MEQPRRLKFTADEFIAWALDQAEGRFELDNGVVVGMAPERANHAIAKSQAWLALRTSIVAKGLACRAFPDGMAVRVNDHSVYEPDVLVRCGPPLPGDAIEIADPVIVVEVVSPSSRGVDRGAKLAGYFELPSLRHYLIVDTEKRIVIHHRRDEQGRLEVQVRHEGSLELDPPGLAIDLADVFDGI